MPKKVVSKEVASKKNIINTIPRNTLNLLVVAVIVMFFAGYIAYSQSSDAGYLGSIKLSTSPKSSLTPDPPDTDPNCGDDRDGEPCSQRECPSGTIFRRAGNLRDEYNKCVSIATPTPTQTVKPTTRPTGMTPVPEVTGPTDLPPPASSSPDYEVDYPDYSSSSSSSSPSPR